MVSNCESVLPSVSAHINISLADWYSFAYCLVNFVSCVYAHFSDSLKIILVNNKQNKNKI